ncbi:MAG: OmpA family protein [Flavobacteriales bacterium]|nr:OmpA family protein [Flavobacteriales bacterium]MCB9198241.1 OmpA family protein [Flavobacteriales bacterium]
MKLSWIFIVAVAFIVACVPARKYEELEAKQKQCAEELETLKSKVTGLETQNTELQALIPDLQESIARLKGDTTLLGKSLRLKEQQYDKINQLNDELIAKLEKLQKGSAEENQKLMTDLNATKLMLQQKEDELKQLETELNAKKETLDKLSIELAEREKRVNELEDLIAKKDAAVNALKEKVANALMGFKDKGLTVEQKNGKVYVSMEAKLLFPSGSTQIDPEGKKALIELAKVLQDQKDLEVLVEGHTDTDALKSSSHPKNNWELSVLRATAVVEIMLANSTMDKSKITAAGRSEFVPLDPNDKAKNRRIEIILIPNLDELFEIISNDN